MNEDKPEGRVIFRMTTNPEDDITGVDDVALEYIVCQVPDACAGIVVTHALASSFMDDTRAMDGRLIRRFAMSSSDCWTC